MGREINDTIIVQFRIFDIGNARSRSNLISSGLAPSSLATARSSSAVSGNGGMLGKSHRIGSYSAIEGSQASVEACHLLRCAYSRCPSKMGSPNPIIGLALRQLIFPAKILRLATEGRMVIAYLRTSQSTEPKSLSSGSLVISTCGGRLVRAPLRTNDNRVFSEIIDLSVPTPACKADMRDCGQKALEILLERHTQCCNRLGYVVRTDRHCFHSARSFVITQT